MFRFLFQSSHWYSLSVFACYLLQQQYWEHGHLLWTFAFPTVKTPGTCSTFSYKCLFPFCLWQTVKERWKKKKTQTKSSTPVHRFGTSFMSVVFLFLFLFSFHGHVALWLVPEMHKVKKETDSHWRPVITSKQGTDISNNSLSIGCPWVAQSSIHVYIYIYIFLGNKVILLLWDVSFSVSGSSYMIS